VAPVSLNFCQCMLPGPYRADECYCPEQMIQRRSVRLSCVKFGANAFSRATGYAILA
jgi:hypothetical protein